MLHMFSIGNFMLFLLPYFLDMIGDLISSALMRYQGAHHLSAEKLVYLKFFSEVCLPEDRRQYARLVKCIVTKTQSVNGTITK